MAKRRRRIRVKYLKKLKLGKKNVWGLADESKLLIELDEKLKGKKHLEILTHEVIHLLLPSASEEEVERMSIDLINVLWREGYRRVDDQESDPLQDGYF